MIKFVYRSKKCQLLINGRKKLGIKTLKNLKVFIDYSQTIVNVHENLEDYNPAKKRRDIFDEMIADMESNRKNNNNKP